ncbi:MAG TPA: CRTAC1 family protein, partial [Acidobacteriota bacterium]|nr:CRTAC1 family protein [Acidobacteriota bacterium]
VVANSGLDLVQSFGSLDKSYITESTGSGAALVDFDVDGTLDVVLVNALSESKGDLVQVAQPGTHPALAAGRRGEGHRLYRGDGRTFHEAPASAGVREAAWGTGVTWGDVDNDGWPDLFIAAIGADRLYRNNGDGTFAVWSSGTEDNGWGAAATFTDWDADGNLDLYVARYVDLQTTEVLARGEGRCSYAGVEAFCGPEGLAGQRDLLYHNLADGTFVAWMSDRIDPAAGYGLALAAIDCDDDGLSEIYVANDSTMNLLYRRTPNGEIEEQGLLSGAGYSADGREQAGMGVTSADFDGDGRLDLYVTNFHNDHNTLYRNLGDCTFQDETDLRKLATSSFPYMGWSALFFDVDGDADQDLFVANGHIHPAVETRGIEPYGQLNSLYVNQLRESGAASFSTVSATSVDALTIRESSRGAVRGDIDNDGDLDLLVTNIDARPTLIRNSTPMAHAALRITLVGRGSNRSGYGADVIVRSGIIEQRQQLRDSDGYAGANDSRLLFYLPSGVAEEIEIRWPGGETMHLPEQPPGHLVVDEQYGVVARAAQ